MAQMQVWWRAFRPWSFTVSVVPPLLGGILAFQALGLSWSRVGFWLLCLLGAVVTHAASNMVSDYCDYKTRVDRPGTYGSSGVLVDRSLTPAQVWWAGVAGFAIGALIALFFVWRMPSLWPLLWPALLAGGVLGFFYTVPPFKFKYRALGDLAVFLAFGSLMSYGTFVVLTRTFSWAPLLFVLPVAFLVDGILHGNNWRDIDNDKAVGVTTLAGHLGKNGARWYYLFLLLCAYVSVVVLVIWAHLTPWALLTWVSLPLALATLKPVWPFPHPDTHALVMLDASTAKLHSAFGVLLLVGLLVSSWL